MISMQQLEELENRIVKALQLITDLRSENATYENENETLRSEVEEARLSLEEKDQEIQRLKAEVEQASRELREIREREEVLEKKVIGLLGKLDILQSGTGSLPAGIKPVISDKVEVKKDTVKTVSTESTPLKTGITVPPVVISDIKTEPLLSSGISAKEDKKHDPGTDKDFEVRVDDVNIETVDSSETMDDDDDDDIIIIDEDSNVMDDDIVIETGPDDDDDIVLLDDDDDDIIIDDVDDEIIIIDDQESPKDKKSKTIKTETLNKKSKVDDDDEFLIIEDDDK